MSRPWSNSPPNHRSKRFSTPGASRFGPDACLIDFNMPGMNGCELARRLRARGAEDSGYLILMTAHTVEAMAKEMGICDFDFQMVKPVDWDKLSGVLAKLERRLGSDGAATKPTF